MKDTEYRLCPTCGARARAADALCPACKTAFADGAPAPGKSESSKRDPAAETRLAPSVRGGAAEAPPGIEGHRILRELGRGGMGVVYLAREQGWNRDVALKLANKGLNERQERRFVEEAQLTARLQHPAIVPIYRMGRTTDGRAFYSMKRVQGQTLAHMLMQLRDASPRAAEQFGLRRRMAVLLAACEGVGYAHDHGVIHRDLKPANIMVGEYGEVYVLDWGLARVLFAVGLPDQPPDLEALSADERKDPEGSASASRRRISGTPAYMSPEQARGENRKIDCRADVWSLGAMMFQLLTFHAPVEGADAGEILRKLIENRIAPVEQYPGGRAAPRELLDILGRALQLDLNQRYPNARAMAEDLRDYLDGRGRWRLAYEWQHASGTTPEDAWTQTLGRWKLDARGLYPQSRKSKGAVLLGQRRIMGDVRVELRGYIEGSGAESGELSVLLCAPEPEPGVNETDGYCLQFGADWNTSAKLCKNDVDLTVRAGMELERGRPYTVAGERVGNRLSLEVDGEELLRFEDLVPLNGYRVGLYGWGNGVRIESIRVFRRGLDAMVSCMAVPDHDFNRGRYTEAFSGYARIAEELAGQEEGWMARFKTGLSRLEADDPLGAEAEFAKMDQTPGEVLAQLGRSLLSAREGDYRRELLRLGAARRAGQGSPALDYVTARLWVRAEELYAANRFEQAAAYFSEALEAGDETGKRRTRALANMALCQFQLGHIPEAMRAVERLEAVPSPYNDALRSLYGALFHHFCDQGNWDEALACCARYERFPELAHEAVLRRAEAERMRGGWDAARGHAARALDGSASDSQRMTARQQLALLDLDAGRLDEAMAGLETVAAFKGTLEIGSQPETRANILAMQGQGTKALALLAALLKREDHRRRMILLLQLGRMLRMRGEPARAKECLLQALPLLHKYLVHTALEAELETGLACLALHERTAANEAFNRAASYPLPAFPKLVVQSFRDWRIGESAPEPPEPGRACPWARRADYFFYLGEYALLQGRREDAVRCLRRALIDAVSPYRYYPWLAAARLKELGENLPKHIPDFPPLGRRRGTADKPGG